jgi:hypothetical protein
VSVYILGSKHTALIVGVTHCEELGEKLPFFALAPAQSVLSKLKSYGETKAAVEIFREHGTVIFFDNPDASEAMLDAIEVVLNDAAESDWIDRKSAQEFMQ